MKINTYLDELGLEPRTYKIPTITPLFQKWNFDKILEHITKNSVSNIADIGAKNGALTIYIRQNLPESCQTYFTLVDQSNTMLIAAGRNLSERGLDAKLRPSSPTWIRTIDDQSFDYIISNNAFHHESNKDELYAEMFRLLAPHGKLIYSDFYDIPDKEFAAERGKIWTADREFSQRYKDSADKAWHTIPKALRKNHPFEYHLTFEQVRERLNEAGFDVNKTEIIPSPMYFAIVCAEKPNNNNNNSKN